MKCVKMERNTDRYDYDYIASSGEDTAILGLCLSEVKVNCLLKMIKESDICGGSELSYIITVEPNIYIGFTFDDLTWEQRIILRDDPRYLFKTTKQGFIDLVHQWAKVHEKQPPGISIKEISTDLWEVKPMTEKEVVHYKAIADPVTSLLPDDVTNN